jgi:hypothetical protein
VVGVGLEPAARERRPHVGATSCSYTASPAATRRAAPARRLAGDGATCSAARPVRRELLGRPHRVEARDQVGRRDHLGAGRAHHVEHAAGTRSTYGTASPGEYSMAARRPATRAPNARSSSTQPLYTTRGHAAGQRAHGACSMACVIAVGAPARGNPTRTRVG